MRNLILACAVAVAALAGCSKKQGPVTVTPEMEAEQQQAQKDASMQEAARKKTEKPARSGQQEVLDQEKARQKN